MKIQTKNTLASVAQQATAIVCGLILPREILARYGSEMNGAAHAIAQFLSYVTLAELGIGAVIPSALYAPLLAGDDRQVSAILASGRRVFRRMALLTAGAAALLIAFFPLAAGDGIPRMVIAQLVLAIAAGRAALYLAGTAERLLLVSDQKGYVPHGIAAVSAVVNTAVQIALIRAGASLPAVKAVGSAFTVLQIALICLYVRRHYRIDRRVRVEGEPIPQKWDGVAQHVAYFVLENTDVVLLTLFVSLREVSVYSVYFLVISGVRRIFVSVSGSVQPKLGELWARGDSAALNRFFASFERWIHLAAAAAFGLLGLWLVPFVRAYTAEVGDADYARPLFALLMTLAYGAQSVRDPYDKLILAAGHYRQTRANYIAAAAMNLGISLLAVRRWGLEGVAAGTLAAMAYQTVYMALYDGKHLLRRSPWIFLRRVAADAALAGGMVLLWSLSGPDMTGAFAWVLGLVRPG